MIQLIRLTPAIEDMGYSLAEVTDRDLNDYIKVSEAVYKKYIVHFHDFFGDWNEEILHELFNEKKRRAFFMKLLLDNETTGFLCFDDKKDKIDGVSIQILEKAQNRGIGTFFLSSLADMSRSSNKTVYLEVVKTNPSVNLYKRLGFDVYKETEVFYYLQHKP